MPSYDACIWLGWDGFIKHSFFDYITTSPTSFEYYLDLYSDVHYTFQTHTPFEQDSLKKSNVRKLLFINSSLFNSFINMNSSVISCRIS